MKEFWRQKKARASPAGAEYDKMQHAAMVFWQNLVRSYSGAPLLPSIPSADWLEMIDDAAKKAASSRKVP